MPGEEGDALAARARGDCLPTSARPGCLRPSGSCGSSKPTGDRTQAPAQPCHRRVRLRPRGVGALPAGALDRPRSRRQGAAPGTASFAAYARPVGQGLRAGRCHPLFPLHYAPSSERTDRRCAGLTLAAVEWINEHWREFRNPRHLYRAWREQAKTRDWVIPSESWLYRRWRAMPAVVRVAHLSGRAAYESKYAPYVPRDFTDLEALQVLCGDHSERDVTVLLDDGSLARPWLTLG